MSTPGSVPSLPGEPDDSGDTRDLHFRALLRSTETWAYLLGGSLSVGVVGFLVAGVKVGAIAFVVALLVGLYVVSKIAGSRAADDFFYFYARKRGMFAGGRRSLPPDTPLLRAGDDRYAERSLVGELAPGMKGTIALYTYVTESRDSNGHREKQYHPFTLAMTEVPGSSPHMRSLYCRPRSGVRSLEVLEDLFRGSEERVELESQALADRYEIFSTKEQDPNWVRQFLSPTFIVWLTESTPETFAFEIDTGTVVTYVAGHVEDAAGLDLIAAVTVTVARRLGEETAESDAVAG